MTTRLPRRLGGRGKAPLLATTPLAGVILLAAAGFALHAEDRDGVAPKVVSWKPSKVVWVTDPRGKTVPGRPLRRERGLQTSGLHLRAGRLWSVGDQRSEYPGHLYCIDPKTGRLAVDPIPIQLDAKRTGERFDRYRALPNPDLEGLTAHPRHDDGFLIVTEDKTQWIMDVRLESTAAADAKPKHWRATLAEITELQFPEDLKSYRGDPNYRLEGIAATENSAWIYLAYERLDDGLPRVYRIRVDAATGGEPIRPEDVPIDFAAMPLRSDKKRARLNLNGLAVWRKGPEERLIAVARDQERVLVIDPRAGVVERIFDLQLRSPDGAAMLWVSPEGIALDPTGRRLWIVNDPDSIRGNYRKLDNETARGRFAEFAPLLFVFELDPKTMLR